MISDYFGLYLIVLASHYYNFTLLSQLNILLFQQTLPCHVFQLRYFKVISWFFKLLSYFLINISGLRCNMYLIIYCNILLLQDTMSFYFRPDISLFQYCMFTSLIETRVLVTQNRKRKTNTSRLNPDATLHFLCVSVVIKSKSKVRSYHKL